MDQLKPPHTVFENVNGIATLENKQQFFIKLLTEHMSTQTPPQEYSWQLYRHMSIVVIARANNLKYSPTREWINKLQYI